LHSYLLLALVTLSADFPLLHITGLFGRDLYLTFEEWIVS
jgi:hypothetical protein